MLDRPQLAAHDARRPHSQNAVHTDRQVIADAVNQLDGDAELLLALADDRGTVRLARVDFAAWQLPVTGECCRRSTLRDQDAAGAVEQGGPDDDLLRHAGHHRTMPDQPALLSADEVQTELGRLVGWAGDTDGIERSIQAASFLGA